MTSDSATAGLPSALRRRQWWVIIGVLALAALIAAAALLKPAPRRAGGNQVQPGVFIATIDGGSGPACVRKLSLPPGTAGLRTMLGTYGRSGPAVTMTLSDGAGKVIRRSSLVGYGDGRSPIFRFAVLPNGVTGATACYRVKDGRLAFTGMPNGNATDSEFFVGDKPAKGDISMEYMRPGDESALGMLGTVMRRAALFRPAWVRPWTFYLIFFAAIAAIAGAVALLVRLGRGNPFGRGSMAALALIVFVNAAAWAILTPAFNVPDEFAHYTYVETLANGELPDKSLAPGDPGNGYVPSTVVVANYSTLGIIQNNFARMPWSEAAERKMKTDSLNLLQNSPNAAFGITPAASYSPLYYAPAALVYKVVGGHGTYGKLLAARLYSALLVALTALLVVLLARELLPSVPWFAPVAGLAVAFEPMFLHVGGGVSNDNMLVLFSTATLYFLARMLRRGPTTASAIGAGSAFALGYIAKPTILGLAPAVALAFVVAFLRAREDRKAALRQLALGFAAFLAIFGLGAALLGTGGETGASLGASGTAQPATVTGFASYVWQYYLPAIPGMTDFFNGTPPAMPIFLRGFFANFNALDTAFPNWIYGLVAVALAGLVAGAALAIYRRRAALPERWPLVAMPLVAVVSMMLFVNTASYMMFTQGSPNFAQGRYLFPIMGIFGSLVAAGSLGAGRKRGLVVATGLVLALAVLNIFGMGLSMARFYI